MCNFGSESIHIIYILIQCILSIQTKKNSKLIWVKLGFINLFPLLLIVVGCLYVYDVRKDNYGCGYDENGNPEPLVSSPPDEGPKYDLFCVLLVTYALELLVFPAIIANKIIRWLRSNKITQKKRNTTKAKGERLEQCLGGVLKCVSCCFPDQGGKELKNQGEMKDFASNLVSCYCLCAPFASQNFLLLSFSVSYTYYSV